MSVRARISICGVLVTAVGLLAPGMAAAAPGNSGSFVLTARSTAGHYAPTFTGNGLLGIRVPPAGEGYAGGTVPAQSELAGFYAKPDSAPKASERVQQRANIPTWSTLSFADGGATFSPDDRQRLGLEAVDRPAYRRHHDDRPLDGARPPRHRHHLPGVHRPRP